MKYSFLRILAVILPGFALGQSFTLPSLAADSAYYEIVKGRKCEKALGAQLSATIKLQTAALADGKLITLLKSQNTLQDSIASAFQKEIEAKQVIHEGEKESLQDKIKGLWKWIAGLGALDVALLLILLL